MTLTLAIPCHDDAEPLARLLARARALGCFDHVVVVDDGSPRPLAAGALCAATGLAPSALTLIRHDTARGPGPARVTPGSRPVLVETRETQQGRVGGREVEGPMSARTW